MIKSAILHEHDFTSGRSIAGNSCGVFATRPEETATTKRCAALIYERLGYLRSNSERARAK
jgi:hypothetical protein